MYYMERLNDCVKMHACDVRTVPGKDRLVLGYVALPAEGKSSSPFWANHILPAEGGTNCRRGQQTARRGLNQRKVHRGHTTCHQGQQPAYRGLNHLTPGGQKYTAYRVHTNGQRGQQTAHRGPSSSCLPRVHEQQEGSHNCVASRLTSYRQNRWTI